MPGFDGTGPRGLGPMTGRGRGYCLLKIPRTSNEPLTGFAGLPGYPVSVPAHRMDTNLATLRARMQAIEAALLDTQNRLTNLKTAARTEETIRS